MKAESCTSCKWFFDQTCRRFPPQVSVVMVPQRAPMGVALKGQAMTMQPTPVAAFPPIAQPDEVWCGEHSTVLARLS